MAVKSNLTNMVLVLGVTCLVCSALLGGAYAITKEPIEKAVAESEPEVERDDAQRGEGAGDGGAARLHLSVAYIPPGVFRRRLFGKRGGIARYQFMEKLHASFPPKKPFCPSLPRNCRR